MGKILVSASHFDTLCAEAMELFKSYGHEIIYDPKREFPAYSFEELQEIIGDIDAALIGMDVYNEDVFKIAHKLKAVAKFGVGVDNIDCEAATKYRVKVINAPGQNSNAVAELVVGFMISVLRGIIPLHKQVEQGLWPRFIGEEIKNKTIGLYGFGAIARLVAKKLQYFDVNIIAYDLYPDYEKAKELNVTMTSAENVIEKSDILSLHIPSTAQNYHLIDREIINRMKHGAYIINTARGNLIDLDALSNALKEGCIAGAAIDAFEAEPLSKDSSILDDFNTVLTPHTGAETKEAYRNVSLSTAKDIIAVLDGKEPHNWVNRYND